MNTGAQTNESDITDKKQTGLPGVKTVWAGIVPAVIALAIITTVTIIRKDRVMQPETAEKQIQESPYLKTETGNGGEIYAGYQEQSFASADGKWKVKIENLVDFDGNCQGRIGLYDSSGQPVNSPEENGWKGSYRTNCTIRQGGADTNPLISGFSGWAKTKNKFFIVSPSPEKPGITETRYAILSGGKWIQTGFDIRGNPQTTTDELDYFATAEKALPGTGTASATIRTYGQDGRMTLSKEIKTVSELKFLPVEGTNKTVVIAPQSDPATSGQEEVYMYLTDMAAGKITGPVAGTRILAAGKGCVSEMKAVQEDRTGTITVSSGCLAQEYRFVKQGSD